MSELFVKSAAGLSDCTLYRYWLTRIWDDSLPLAIWFGVNPSRANAERNDPTIIRVCSFTRGWGLGGVAMLNLHALITPYPAVMRSHEYPTSEPHEHGRNDRVIRFFLRGERPNDNVRIPPGKIIAAWGCNGTHLGRDRAVMELLSGHSVECLGITKDGHPKHPVRLARTTPLVPFTMPGIAAI